MKIAIVGATGMVGKVMLEVLAERKIKFDNLILVASERSIGKKVSFQDKIYSVIGLNEALNLKPDIALFSAGAETSLNWAPKFVDKGTTVIDNSSAWRMDPNIKLIGPEINASILNENDKIIANPNCSTIQMVLALNPLHKSFNIKRVVVSTYQAVSGAGKAAMDELVSQTKDFLDKKKVKSKNFTKQIAFNLIPHIDVFVEDGYTKEEWKMENETKKILNENIKVTATCVRVPVITSHSESVNVEFVKNYNIDEVKELLSETPGCKLVDEHVDGGYMTPLEAQDDFKTYISRVRKDRSNEKAINMWIVSDNLLKGAALNSVQIAETLVKYGIK